MYFSRDFAEARSRFRARVQALGGTLETLPVSACGPNREALGIDIGWFGALAPDFILLHSSGLHGVEGFAGSAIQLQFLEHFPRLPDHVAVVVVHVLNPYGMAWLRRVNESNVDLNRNFLIGESYTGAPAKYAALNDFLNPSTATRVDFFWLRAVRLLLRHGMAPLKQAVAGGQYDFPDGLFFGGAQLESGPTAYAAFLKRALSTARAITSIDVHTGLGNYGEDTLLVETEDYAPLHRKFGSRVVASKADVGPAYSVRGGIHGQIRSASTHAKVECICQEFGTYGSIRVLRALRDENHWHRYGDGGLDHESKEHLREVFCPADQKWRESVLIRGQALIETALNNLGRRSEP